MKRLQGITVALVTPFNEDGSVDFGAARALVDFLVANRVDGLYVCGTTGEFPLLSEDERRRLAQAVVSHASGRVAVYVQTGDIRTDVAATLSMHARSIGADGVGVVTPYYFTYSQDQLFDYYQAVAGSVPDDFPVYLYNIPQRTTNALSPALVGRLAQACPNIVGLKDSSGSLKTITEFMMATADRRFDVIQGADEQLLSGLVLGCRGSISGNANAFPHLLVDVWERATAGEWGAARDGQMAVAEVSAALGYGNIPMIKEALREQGLGNGLCRPPFGPISPAGRSAVQELLRRHKPGSSRARGEG